MGTRGRVEESRLRNLHERESKADCGGSLPIVEGQEDGTARDAFRGGEMNGVERAKTVLTADHARSREAKIIDGHDEHSFPVGPERGLELRECGCIKTRMAQRHVRFGERQRRCAPLRVASHLADHDVRPRLVQVALQERRRVENEGQRSRCSRKISVDKRAPGTSSGRGGGGGRCVRGGWRSPAAMRSATVDG